MLESLRSRFREESETVDEWYAVRRSAPDSGGGWSTVEGWDRLDEPVTRERFELNTDRSELAPGQYRLFKLEDGDLRGPGAEHEWEDPVVVEGDGDPVEEERREQLAELRDVLARLDVALQERGDGADPVDVVDDPAEFVALRMLEDPELVEEHQDVLARIALRGFGLVDDDGRLDAGEFDGVLETLAAVVVDAYENPAQTRAVAEALGGAVGAFLDGLMGEMGDVDDVDDVGGLGDVDRGDVVAGIEDALGGSDPP